ncbi:hypothetical protein J2Y69_000392 [Microbacterium resistens]|uniref:Uncharacterized protein n=1 Tax=Microbacterium resistens TaxID=156977 RepID=A0ABU1S875_9MICO|nr:hypothetical protein [Microbacterium resistens]
MACPDFLRRRPRLDGACGEALVVWSGALCMVAEWSEPNHVPIFTTFGFGNSMGYMAEYAQGLHSIYFGCEPCA